LGGAEESILFFKNKKSIKILKYGILFHLQIALLQVKPSWM